MTMKNILKERGVIEYGHKFYCIYLESQKEREERIDQSNLFETMLFRKFLKLMGKSNRGLKMLSQHFPG